MDGPQSCREDQLEMRRLEGHFGGPFDSSSCSLLKLPGVSHFRLDTLGSLWFHPLFSCLLRRQCYQDQQGSGGQGSNYFHSLSCWEGSWESNGRPACHSWMKSHSHANLGCCWGGRGLFETAAPMPAAPGGGLRIRCDLGLLVNNGSWFTTLENKSRGGGMCNNL